PGRQRRSRSLLRAARIAIGRAARAGDGFGPPAARSPTENLLTPRRIRAASALAAVALWLSAGPLPASETRIWLLDSASDFSTGEARGVSVTGDGTLALARGLEVVSGVS